MKETMGKDYMPPAERDAAIRALVVVAVIAQWAIVATGITAGTLLILRRRAGRWLAFALYTVILSGTLYGRWRLVADAGWKTNLRLWAMMAHLAPGWTAGALVDLAVPAAGLAYLAIGARPWRSGGTTG